MHAVICWPDPNQDRLSSYWAFNANAVHENTIACYSCQNAFLHATVELYWYCVNCETLVPWRSTKKYHKSLASVRRRLANDL